MVRACGKNARRKKTVKKVFKNIQEGKSSVGKPRNRRLDHAENDLKKMGIRVLRKIARDRYAWKLILKESKGLHGPCSQRRRR